MKLWDLLRCSQTAWLLAKNHHLIAIGSEILELLNSNDSIKILEQRQNYKDLYGVIGT